MEAQYVRYYSNYTVDARNFWYFSDKIQYRKQMKP